MRAMIYIFFTYSFIYFFLVFRPRSHKAYLAIGVLFEALNGVMVVTGLLGFVVL